MGKVKYETIAELILDENTDEVEVVFYDKDTKEEIYRCPVAYSDALNKEDYCIWVETSKEQIKEAITDSANKIIGEVHNYPLDKPE